MTKFEKARFTDDGTFVFYVLPEPLAQKYAGTKGLRGDRLFILREKYARPEKRWINFIIKNFTVEEYVQLVMDGESPLGIVNSKGFVCRNQRKACRLAGYPQTYEGFRALIDARVAAYTA
jgi:hypothetical protein